MASAQFGLNQFFPGDLTQIDISSIIDKTPKQSAKANFYARQFLVQIPARVGLSVKDVQTFFKFDPLGSISSLVPGGGGAHHPSLVILSVFNS
jgi:hypothetical protein